MNGENLSNVPKPIHQPAYDKDGKQIPAGTEQAELFQPAMQQRGFYQTCSSPQEGMLQQPAQPASIFQQQQIQPAAPMNGTAQRTTIMSSGRGVRNSVLSDINFTQGFLQTQIGRYVKVEFLIGTNMFVDREGTLIRVGTDYIIIQEPETDDYLLCDIYSIKFIRFYY
ncbi:hypothetical protein Cst_c09240 [Thermoclostridium stercorarium subsp. stercorarium DSM 8532]|uniref:Uncharacterized protein n=1 Tax=Thermoclostridium stercorarium (strain ATCC 35414 / DSM 8532 / NCIMB 11754) TaxID=1121335 RepID=L7VME4_THES1|nr:hypothetical protein [Thermoclostridium stercorarium]AGC67922.1 hypothetical protein Cst_c09240 [Thermoclostridium stercorarium subsp. stercorarium DSM 8532]AGI38960.1 hypothetical protein Clst_0886 [Thermoclostridium stercorarium subsp. stercorarium DSM 8532]